MGKKTKKKTDDAMNREQQQLIFELLAAQAAADGRGDMLLGDGMRLARPVFSRAVSGDVFPMVYLEFPLLGTPSFDLLVGYKNTLRREGLLSDADYFGYAGMMDFFTSLPDDHRCGCGYEIDLSSGETARAGIYLQHYGRLEMTEPFLRSCGEEARLKVYEDAARRLGDEWRPDYIGLFPGREGSPTRIGGYFSDSKDLRDLFDRAGFTAWDAEMLGTCEELMRYAEPADYQFDLLSDGSVRDVFGLAFSFGPRVRPVAAAESMRSGPGAEFMRRLEAMGLADGRWRKIPDAVFTKAIPVIREDGSEGLMALAVLLNFAKIKFVKGRPHNAKFYYCLCAQELA